jgi:hypothetical protein
MPNKARGDAEFVAGDKRYAMRLTLGALAEIEDALGADSLADLAERLKHLGTGDIALVASALMRGASADISAAEVLKLDADLGALIAAIGRAFDAAGLGGTPPGSVVAGDEGGKRDPRPLAGTSSSPPGSA